MPDFRPRDGVCRRLDLINATLHRIADAHAALAKNVERLANNQATKGTIDVDRAYTRAETARLLNVSIRTIDRRISDGSLIIFKHGNTVRIDGSSLRRHRKYEQLVGARRVQKL